MCPLAIGVDCELNSKFTAAKSDEARTHRLQVDDREVVARIWKKPWGNAWAGASERKHLHATIHGSTRIAQEQCAGAVPAEPHSTCLRINRRGPMRKDMPGEVYVVGPVRQ